MDFGAFKLPNIRIGKQLFRLLFMFLLFLLLATRFEWAKGIYDRVFASPELRIHQYAPDSDVVLDQEVRFQRVILLQNRGRKAAVEVYISVSVPQGRISRYDIASQEAYTVTASSHLDTGSLSISLPRLAPEATIAIYVWGASSIARDDLVLASAVADSGVAKPLGNPTALEESEGYAVRIAGAIREAYHSLRAQPRVQTAHQALSSKMPAAARNLLSDVDFTSMAVAALILVGLTWLFWSRTAVISLLAVVGTVFTWLFFDFSVSMLLYLILTVVIMLLTAVIIKALKDPWARRPLWAFLGFMVITAGLTLALRQPIPLVDARMSGGPYVGYGIFVVALLLGAL
jgi:hypothetical protein